MKPDLKMVVFFTSAFPYLPGEQFIETEIGYWNKLPWAQVVICPSSGISSPRAVPDGIKVIPPPHKITYIQKIWLCLRALFCSTLWRELAWLQTQRTLTLRNIVVALSATARLLKSVSDIKNVMCQLGNIDLAYFYWNAEPAYAACTLKATGQISRVVSRAHGFDLYEERRSQGYMPLKRQFVNDFDAVFAISEQGRKYLERQYGFANSMLKISRLGVHLPEIAACASSDGILRVVSVSFCVPVKRIDKIIEALRLLCHGCPGLPIQWTHIGDGPLRPQLERLAAEQLGRTGNASFQFLGALPNADVLAYYEKFSVDVFVNCSESEGVPVSIMEAMSYGIPAVATAVGGTPELVDDHCGVLVSEEANPVEIASAIQHLIGESYAAYRIAARRKVMEKYNGRINYEAFVSCISELAQNPALKAHSKA